MVGERRSPRRLVATRAAVAVVGAVLVAALAGVAVLARTDSQPITPTVATPLEFAELPSAGWPVRLVYEVRTLAFADLSSPVTSARAQFAGRDWFDWEHRILERASLPGAPAPTGEPGCLRRQGTTRTLLAEDDCLGLPIDVAAVSADTIGAPLPHLLPYAGLDPGWVRANATSVSGSVRGLLDRLGVSAAEVVSVHQEGRKRCGDLGLSCPDVGELPWRLTRVIHVPSGLELLEVEELDGGEVHRFEVVEIDFNADWTPAGP
ncbi:MAG: hypothetical protein ACLGIR_12525 [Actinomycetes bacterium]